MIFFYVTFQFRIYQVNLPNKYINCILRFELDDLGILKRLYEI